MWKCAGAKAAKGGTLDEVISAAQKAIDHCRSVGIGLTPCTLPAVGHPNFEIKEGTMESGSGTMGNRALKFVRSKARSRWPSACSTSCCLIILPEWGRGCVLVSGLGATPLMEVYVLYHEIESILEEKGIRIYRHYAGNFFTSLDMMGTTVTVMKLDEELKELMDMDVWTMGFKQN